MLQRLFHVDRVNRVFNQSLSDSNQLDINEFLKVITDKTLNQAKNGQDQSVFALQEKITPEQNGLKVDLLNIITPQHGF